MSSVPSPHSAPASAAPPGAAAIEALSPWREGWRVFRANKAAIAGLAMLTLIVVSMVLGPGWYGVAAMDIAAGPFTPILEILPESDFPILRRLA